MVKSSPSCVPRNGDELGIWKEVQKTIGHGTTSCLVAAGLVFDLVSSETEVACPIDPGCSAGHLYSSSLYV